MEYYLESESYLNFFISIGAFVLKCMKNRPLQERVSAIFTMVEFQGFCSREDFRELAEAAGG